ncbi:hypothetical protein LGN17_18015 [Burkholderia sp. AU30280]|uniref:hypothetical protein n=1 Tax=Burkholderia sp. AU30280 TaxID=2879628 RepID=UPI001CF2056F|nr:hypothetical protein [Burkholderia sp. AU30280]MCA8274388.1 hypothetical protein [Burkholderia sp. AU30280]
MAGRPHPVRADRALQRPAARRLRGTLEQAARTSGKIGANAFGIATLSAVVASDYAHATHPDLALPSRAPTPAAVVDALARHPAFVDTCP